MPKRKRQFDYDIDIETLERAAEKLVLPIEEKRKLRDKITILRSGGRVDVDFASLLEQDKKNRRSLIEKYRDKISRKFAELRVGDSFYYNNDEVSITKINGETIQFQSKNDKARWRLEKFEYEEGSIIGKIRFLANEQW